MSVQQRKETFRRCVETDFDYLLALPFAASRTTMQDLLPQSVLGRALNGHGWFWDEDGAPLQFPDAGFDRICTILEQHDPQRSNLKVRARRNRQIERLQHQVLTHISRPEIPLCDADGPLFGIRFLEGKTVETVPFLKGLLLAGWMDSYHWRMATLKHKLLTFSTTTLELGGGDMFAVNRQQLTLSGLGDTGNRVFTDADIDELHRLGVIERGKDQYVYPHQDQQYFRRGDGQGISDDLALLYIGKLYGFDALLGAFLMDAVDSYDKFLLTFTPGGMDAHLAECFTQAWREQHNRALLHEQEMNNLIHFAARQNIPTTRLSSSHRRLIQYEDQCDVPTLLHHWRFLQEKPLHAIKLGFAGVPAEEFYHAAMERLYSCGIYLKAPTFEEARSKAGSQRKKR